MSTAQFDKWFGYDGTLERVQCLASGNLNTVNVTLSLNHNIASITYLNGGSFRVVFSKPLPTADYTVSFQGGYQPNAANVGVVQLNYDGASNAEMPTVNGFVFRLYNNSWQPSTSAGRIYFNVFV